MNFLRIGRFACFLAFCLILHPVACGTTDQRIPFEESDPPPEPEINRFSKTFSSVDDFKDGVHSGVTHLTQPGTLQMNQGRTVFETPYIWVANSIDSTISKIDTRSGEVIGTFTLQKDGKVCTDPSRTTVDLDFNVWVGCRGSANVFKVSHKTGEVIFAIDVDPGPRGMAIDANGNFWVGCDAAGATDPVYKIDGQTGECLMGNQPGCKSPAVVVDDFPYGAAIDQRGFLWVVCRRSHTLIKIDTATAQIVGTYRRTDGGCTSFYGIAIDQLNNVWLGNFSCSDVLKFDGLTGEFLGGFPSGGSVTRGVAVDQDGNVWVANSGTSTATKLHGADGKIINTLNVGQHPIGIAVDAYGHVWSVNRNSNDVYKINGLTMEVQPFAVGQGPYTYSDMMGTALRTITLNQSNSAYWTINYDTNFETPTYEEIRWDAEEPATAKISVRTRCAATEAELYSATWSTYLEEPGPMQCDQKRWVQIEAKFAAHTSGLSPILNELSIVWTDK